MRGERMMKLAMMMYVQTSSMKGPALEMDNRARNAFRKRHKKNTPLMIGGSGALGAFLSTPAAIAVGEQHGGKKGALVAGAAGLLGMGIGKLINDHGKKYLEAADGYQGMGQGVYDFDGSQARKDVIQKYKDHFASRKKKGDLNIAGFSPVITKTD